MPTQRGQFEWASIPTKFVSQLLHIHYIVRSRSTMRSLGWKITNSLGHRFMIKNLLILAAIFTANQSAHACVPYDNDIMCRFQCGSYGCELHDAGGVVVPVQEQFCGSFYNKQVELVGVSLRTTCWEVSTCGVTIGLVEPWHCGLK